MRTIVDALGGAPNIRRCQGDETRVVVELDDPAALRESVLAQEGIVGIVVRGTRVDLLTAGGAEQLARDIRSGAQAEGVALLPDDGVRAEREQALRDVQEQDR